MFGKLGEGFRTEGLKSDGYCVARVEIWITIRKGMQSVVAMLLVGQVSH